MHEYDIALKSILTRPAGSALARLTGVEVARWHNTELPEVRSRRADLLGETQQGRLLHVELQSTNGPRMALRMLEYAVAIYRGFDRFPQQVVLYVGEAPLRMECRVAFPEITYEFRAIDIREIESEQLLETGCLEDSIIAVLGRLSDEIGTVRRILLRIAQASPERRGEAISELMILAGLRSLATVVEREIERMPILNDIMDHPVIGRERMFGERTVILNQLRKRFGALPEWATERIEAMGARELEALALRLLDASSLQDLFPFES
jgi:predicted transposase YdaD